jgi:DNA polymerase-1
MHVLRRHGIVVRGYARTRCSSPMSNSTATRHDMDSLAKRYLGYDTIKYEDVAGKGAKQIGFARCSGARGEYAAEDADVTLRLHEALWPKLAAEPALRALYARSRCRCRRCCSRWRPTAC